MKECSIIKTNPVSIVHSEKRTLPSEMAFTGVLVLAGTSTPKCFWPGSNNDEICPWMGLNKTYSTLDAALSSVLNLSSFSTKFLNKESSTSVSKKLNEKLDEYHLLKHPFYKSWNEGKLNREIIKDYAEQYYQHVKAFPRYISATHSICEDLDKRRILLENLQDEEKKDADHPMLWKNFALSVGAKADEIEKKDRI